MMAVVLAAALDRKSAADLAAVQDLRLVVESDKRLVVGLDT